MEVHTKTSKGTPTIEPVNFVESSNKRRFITPSTNLCHTIKSFTLKVLNMWSSQPEKVCKLIMPQIWLQMCFYPARKEKKSLLPSILIIEVAWYYYPSKHNFSSCKNVSFYVSNNSHCIILLSIFLWDLNRRGEHIILSQTGISFQKLQILKNLTFIH